MIYLLPSKLCRQFYSTSSTDTDPKHHLCPQGVFSWCGWQRDLACHTSTYEHKEYLSPTVVEIIQPLFDRLSSYAVLETAVAGQTKNANESLHHVLWQRCPKEGFAGLATVESAAAMVAVEFKRGATALGEIIQEMGFHPGVHAKCAFRATDRKRVHHAEKSLARKRNSYERKGMQRENDSLIKKKLQKNQCMNLVGTLKCLICTSNKL